MLTLLHFTGSAGASWEVTLCLSGCGSAGAGRTGCLDVARGTHRSRRLPTWEMQCSITWEDHAGGLHVRGLHEDIHHVHPGPRR